MKSYKMTYTGSTIPKAPTPKSRHPNSQPLYMQGFFCVLFCTLYGYSLWGVSNGLPMYTGSDDITATA